MIWQGHVPPLVEPNNSRRFDVARTARSEYVYFRHEGAVDRDVFFRINPTSIRFQQAHKGAVTETLGGYYRDVFVSEDPQYSGLLLPDLIIEGETGIGYRRELKEIDWIWRNHGQLKPDGSPADTYFFDLIQVGPFQDIERDQVRCYLIEILNFGWDESVSDPFRIRFTFRCKILRDFNWEGEKSIPQSGGIPAGSSLGDLPLDQRPSDELLLSQLWQDLLPESNIESTGVVAELRRPLPPVTVPNAPISDLPSQLPLQSSGVVGELRRRIP